VTTRPDELPVWALTLRAQPRAHYWAEREHYAWAALLTHPVETWPALAVAAIDNTVEVTTRAELVARFQEVDELADKLRTTKVPTGAVLFLSSVDGATAVLALEPEPLNVYLDIADARGLSSLAAASPPPPPPTRARLTRRQRAR
jgi:hypothetical protein